MNKLINKLQSNSYTTMNDLINDSKVYAVHYDTDCYLSFHNESNTNDFDKNDAMNQIAEMISNEGIDIEENSVECDGNTIRFYIFDTNEF